MVDTVDNFLNEDSEGESPLDFLSDLELRLFIDNGFPLGGSINLTLYDSITAAPLSGLNTGNFLEPATVDASGKVTQSQENTKVIEMTETFIEDAKKADKIIVTFTLYTYGNGSQSVKLYSDYNIIFKAALAFKVSLN